MTPRPHYDLDELRQSSLPKIPHRITLNCTAEGQCWLWAGCSDRNRIPKINVDGKPRSVRRVLYEHFIGEVPAKHEVKARCRNCTCVSPNCSNVYTRSAGMQIEAAHGHNAISTAAKTAAARRRAKLNEDVAAEIRVSPLTLKALAEQHGVTKKVCWLIKHNRAWKNHANPFAGLGSRVAMKGAM